MQDIAVDIQKRIDNLRLSIKNKEEIINNLLDNTNQKEILQESLSTSLQVKETENIIDSKLNMEQDNEAFVKWFKSQTGNFPFPSQTTNIWKEECAYCFSTPFKDNNSNNDEDYGLYINIMNNFQAFCSKHVSIDRHRTGCALYLLEKFDKVVKSIDNKKENDDNIQKPITKLAIGMEGGFEAPSHANEVIIKNYGLTLWSNSSKPDYTIIFQNKSTGVSASSSTEEIYPVLPSFLPPKLATSIDEVIKRDDATRVKEIKAWSAEEEIRPISKYAEALIQIDNPPKISPDPTTWRCAESGMKQNLWLNLSTGHIGSGRKNWDGTGGTGAALNHYQETGGLYPLVVKLGTITPKMDQVEVYSYSPEEDCAVQDPYLDKHLAHFGINVNEMKKTDKTIIEMEIDLNSYYDWSRISEEGKNLQPAKGPEHVGLTNLGNSCYCNSVYQVVFSLENFKQRYLLDVTKSPPINEQRIKYFESSPNKEPQKDLFIQMLKLADAFAQGQSDFVSPKMLKLLLGEKHVDFSTREQQDAAEYFEHMLDRISNDEKNGSNDPTNQFKFLIESRYQCQQSLHVGYKYSTQNILKIRIPQSLIDFAASTATSTSVSVSSDDGESTSAKRQKLIEPTISFIDCLKASIGAFPDATEEIDDFLSPITNKKGIALKTTKFGNFPKILVCQIQRYVIGPDWTPQKLECLVDVPLELELNPYFFRGSGPQEGENILPEVDVGKASSSSVAPSTTSDEIIPDQNVVGLLMSMGFTQNAATRAAIATKNNSDEAANWLMSHLDDADINDPIPSSSSGSKSNGKAINPEDIANLCNFGFDEKSSEFALKQCNGNIEHAAEWLMTHDPSEINSLIIAEEKSNSSKVEQNPKQTSSNTNNSSILNDKEQDLLEQNDGLGKYKLRGFISHVGKSTTGGHYVCHILKNGKWIWYNDEKVVVSEQTPLSLGYLYFYERIDS